MTRFISSRLDLSRLAAIRPALLLDLDYEAILADRLADLQTRLPTVDVLGLETDPLVKLQQTDAYRELLDKGLINDTIRGLLPAFAQGTDLDHIVARSGISRLQIGTTSGGAPIWEDDDTLRMRYFASFAAPAAGSEDGYVFAALTAYPGAHDIAAVGPDVHETPGRVDIVVLAPGGVSTSSGNLAVVLAACTASDVRPLTDWVTVRSATIVPFAAAVTVSIRRGPDPSTVRDAVVSSLQVIVADRYRVGGQVPRAALAAAAFNNGAVTATVTAPVSDIPADPYKAPWCTGITVSVQEVD